MTPWTNGRRRCPLLRRSLAQEQARLDGQLAELTVRPVIAGLRQKAEAIRRRELARALRRLDGLDEETLAQITHLSQTLVNQLLHEPTLRLRAEAVSGEPDFYATAVRDLFNLGCLGGARPFMSVPSYLVGRYAPLPARPLADRPRRWPAARGMAGPAV